MISAAGCQTHAIVIAEFINYAISNFCSAVESDKLSMLYPLTLKCVDLW